MMQKYKIYMEAMIEPIYILIEKRDLLELLKLMWQPYLVEWDKGLETSSKLIYITEDRKGNIIIKDNDSVLHVNRTNTVIELQKLFVKKFRLKRDYYFLHGAVISYYEKGILLLGKSGAGKSTLTTYLCFNNFKYVSDDKVIISTITNDVYPFNRLIQLRDDTLEIMKKYNIYPKTIDVDLYGYKRKSVTNIVPQKVNQINMVIALSRKTDVCDCTIKKISGSDAVQAFLWNGYSANNIRENINLAIALSRKIPTYIMEYYNMNDVYVNLCRICE